MPRTACEPEAGFTLIEMLVSLSLLALAAVLVGQSLALERSFLGRGERRLSDGERVGVAQDLIRSRVEHLSNQTRTEGAASFVDVAGDDGQLSFSSRLNSSQGERLETQRLFAAPNGELRLDSSAGSDAPSDALLSGISHLEIAYYGVAAGQSAPAWRSAWLRQPHPPELVRVRVAFDKAARRWPELVVRPGVTVESACAFDAATGECRTRS